MNYHVKVTFSNGEVNGLKLFFAEEPTLNELEGRVRASVLCPVGMYRWILDEIDGSKWKVEGWRARNN